LLRELKIIPTSENEPCPYGCEENSGYTIEVSKEHPQGIGVPCKCEIFRRQRVKFNNLLRVSAIDQDRHMTFESYEPRHKSQVDALNRMKGSHGSYFLTGPWGTGKTHLATASVVEALKAAIPSVRISAPSLLQRMRAFGADNHLEIEILAQTIPYLVIDDFGKQKVTDWVEERFFELFDKRYSLWKAGQAHTTLTSNSYPKVLKGKIDGAILDRIEGMCELIFIDGDSYRASQKE